MRIERINYQRVFAVGAYLTERIGFEASLEEGEDQRSAIEQMRQMAEDIHREKYPQYYTNGLPKIDPPHAEEPVIPADDVQPMAPPEPEQQFSRSQARLAKLINTTKDVDELAKYKKDAHKEGISYVYMARVKHFNMMLMQERAAVSEYK
jgi:hypothetical protein